MIISSSLFLMLVASAAAQPGSRVPSDIRIAVLIEQEGDGGTRAAEHAVSSAFTSHGYQVVDRQQVDRALERDASLSKLYDIEGAKHLGTRLGSEIVIRGTSKVTTREKTYSSMGGKKVIISQADISAKAILSSTGEVLAAESASAKKPFDLSGDTVLATAGQVLAKKLSTAIDRHLTRTTYDYQLVLLGVTDDQSQSFQKNLKTRLPGTQGVSERGFVDGALTLDLEVAKAQDTAFKKGLLDTPFGGLKIIAREGRRVYFGKIVQAPRPAPSLPVSPKPRAGEPVQPAGTPPTKPEYKRGYDKSWAIVIGVNRYQNWPRLEYAVSDAKEMQALFKGIGFDEVITLFDEDATRTNILRVLGDELFEKTGDNDQLVIFFAGHGQTQDLKTGGKVGYIIPVDGDLENYYSTAISMQQLRELSDRIRAKHILYLVDSCFSGLLTRFRGVNAAFTSSRATQSLAQGAPLETTRRARQVLTAGAEGEVVVESNGHGLFTDKVLNGLGGKADFDNNGYIMAGELYRYVSREVLAHSGNQQTPSFGRLESGIGEFAIKIR